MTSLSTNKRAVTVGALALLTALTAAASLTSHATASTTAGGRHDSDLSGHSAGKPSTYLVSRTPGTLPEGIDITRDGTIYVGSKGTGTIYRGHVRNPRLHPWLPGGQHGRTTATGVHQDPWGRVLVAGAETGQLFLYDQCGRLVSKRSTAGATFLNDFDVSGDSVYITDSANNAIYRARLSKQGLGPLIPWVTSDDFSVAPDFLNGVVATPDGQALLVADWQVSRTYRVDLRTRTANPVIVRGGTLGGDGLLLRGHTLVAVDNDVNADGSLTSFARKARFNDDYTRAWVLDDSWRAGPARQPTTIARDGHRLIWVESRFGIDPSAPPYLAREVRGLR